MSRGKKGGYFVAHVYEEDYRAIQELVKQYPNIETGGDLFGLWKNEDIVVIQHFIGPGKQCSRTTTSFHQDIDYLHKVGSLITTEEGLCNVGEWHSHHQIGMPEPSGADRRTVFSNMPHLGLERFVLFIATIESQGSSGKKRQRDVKPEQIKLRPFLFINSTNDVIKGKIEIIPGKNPHHLDSKVETEIERGAEETISDVDDVRRKVSTGSEKNSDPKTTAEKKGGKEHDKEKPEMKEKPSQHSREPTPEKTSEVDPSAQTFKNDKGLNRKLRDNYPKRQEDQYATSDREKKRLKNGSLNNENQSPNTASREPERRRSTSPQTASGGSQRNVPTTTSPPQGTSPYSTPSHMWQNSNDSQQVGTRHGMGRGGGQEKYLQMTSPAMSQPASFPPSEHLQVGTAQGQGRSVHDQRSGFPSYSQLSPFSHISQSQGKQQPESHPQPQPNYLQPQPNYPQPQPNYPQPQPNYPQPQPNYPQQKNPQSARGEASMKQRPSHSTSNRTPAKRQPGCIPLDNMTGGGFF